MSISNVATATPARIAAEAGQAPPGQNPPHYTFTDEGRRILEELGEDPEREGLVKTPERVEASLRWLTRGYRLSVADVVGDAVFEDSHESMLLFPDIQLSSLFAQHLPPVLVRAHGASIPNARSVGLSNAPRTCA